MWKYYKSQILQFLFLVVKTIRSMAVAIPISTIVNPYNLEYCQLDDEVKVIFNIFCEFMLICSFNLLPFTAEQFPHWVSSLKTILNLPEFLPHDLWKQRDWIDFQ